MAAVELYAKLYSLGIDFEVIDIFEGSRILRLEVEELKEDDDETS